MSKKYTLKSVWQLNEAKSWEDLEQYNWDSFKLVDYQVSNQVLDGGHHLAVSGRLTMGSESGSSVRGGKVYPIKVVYANRNLCTVVNLISDGGYFLRMLDYLPWYERETEVYEEVLQGFDFELRNLEHGRNIIYNNLFIDSMVEALTIWERDFGLKTKGLSIKQRREMVKARYMAQFGQLTEEALKDIIAVFGNAECELIKDYEECVVTIKFVSLVGKPDNLDGIAELLDIILPAHWDYKFEIRYTSWGELKPYEWGQMSPYSWEEAKVFSRFEVMK